ncbi:MAG: non-hydrolyzing UDP-N-acetylglucosamine 2-epimerase [Candidatus Odinarchaeia archaeon]
MIVSVIIGTRPEIIKMAPVIRELQKNNVDHFIIHTGQHYSYHLDKIFFDELNLTPCKYNLDVGSGTHAEETGKMMIGVEKILREENPDIVFVLGDTNTVLAGALAAVKLKIKIGHIEAGLRCYDKNTPEEVNRIVADHISNYLFAPTKKAKLNLLTEFIDETKIIVTGNTIVDSVYQNLEIANKKSNILTKLNLEPNDYATLTLHREENVDYAERLSNIIAGLKLVSENLNLKIVYPIHPRTKKKLKEFGLVFPKEILLIEPLGYLDFLKLLANSKLILTDSGGIQEESCILKIPCVTLRDNTERPETVEVGSNIVAGVDPVKILKSSQYMAHKERDWGNPFGDGTASKKIVEFTKKVIT